MTIETVGIITTNAVLLIGAVWRVSAMLANIKTELVHIIKDAKQDHDDIIVRLNAHEARILNLERRNDRINMERRGNR